VKTSLSYIDWEVNGITVLNLSGPLTLGDGTRLFRQLIDDAIGLGKTKLIVNLAEVYRLDSSGLGELVQAHTTVLKHGGTLKLVKLRPRAQELMQLTRLYTLFELFESEDAAVKSFQKDQ
jgi:anti-sigma B factor antagonist